MELKILPLGSNSFIVVVNSLTENEEHVILSTVRQRLHQQCTTANERCCNVYIGFELAGKQVLITHRVPSTF